MVTVKKELKGKSKKEIYYLHNYIPNRLWDNYPQNRLKYTYKILDYKDNKANEIKFFTNELMEAIAYLSNEVFDEEITDLALVPIPPSNSNKNKKTPMRKSIFLIKDWYLEGITESKYACSKRICNYSNLLNRFKDVNSSHRSKPKDRPTYYDHINSIRCYKDSLQDDNKIYILIDDISTRGTVMEACEDILCNHGADRDSIYKLAIGNTISDYNEKD